MVRGEAPEGGLQEYRRKRRFERTPEPAGEPREAGGIFVVQKHAASHLHYDFRLELEGTLKSWAVPKGPSLDPSVRRLAMHVEDHPVDYARFEGIIPKGEYGGGTVMIWDSGYWRGEGDPAASYRKGALKFTLAGSKLHGRWLLVRGKRVGEEEKEPWYLIKERDEAADPEKDVTLLDRSVASGRSMEEIARGREAVWSPATGARNPELLSAAAVPGAAASPMPEMILPQLATLVKEPPAGEEWLHELKYDGYRLLCRVRGEEVSFFTRRGNDWSERFHGLAEEVRRLGLREAWLDGEAVVVQPDGTTSFQALQNALSLGGDIVYYVFDLLYHQGEDLRRLPLRRRKELLAALLGKGERGAVRYSDHVSGGGNVFFSGACRYLVEGIVSKRSDSSYVSGRGSDWLKTRCANRQEFVIGGYTDPSGSRSGFGALLVGAFDGDGSLRYAGKVGTGFTERTLAELFRRLQPLDAQESPFSNPPAGSARRGVHWVRPELVAEVAYTEITRDGVLRHPSFQGLREDKRPGEVVFEKPHVIREEEESAPPEPAADGEPAELPRYRLSNPDRVLYPREGHTKNDLAIYYIYIAPRMLPHLARRPLTLVRCPEGIAGECFFQKHANPTVPPQVTRIPLQEEGETVEYLTVESPEGVLGLVQMGTLEIHTWGSRFETLETPDRLVFDVDPDESLPWERVAEGTLLLRNRLIDLGLRSFLKTSGGKGFHVVVPVLPEKSWEEVKEFSRSFAESLARQFPHKFTAKMGKENRPGKIFVDWMRNSRGATAVEVYSTRARGGAPLSVPLHWEELAGGTGSREYTLENIGEKLAGRASDPWKEYFAVRQRLP